MKKFLFLCLVIGCLQNTFACDNKLNASYSVCDLITDSPVATNRKFAVFKNSNDKNFEMLYPAEITIAEYDPAAWMLSVSAHQHEGGACAEANITTKLILNDIYEKAINPAIAILLHVKKSDENKAAVKKGSLDNSPVLHITSEFMRHSNFDKTVPGLASQAGVTIVFDPAILDQEKGLIRLIDIIFFRVHSSIIETGKYIANLEQIDGFSRKRCITCLQELAMFLNGVRRKELDSSSKEVVDDLAILDQNIAASLVSGKYEYYGYYRVLPAALVIILSLIAYKLYPRA